MTAVNAIFGITRDLPLIHYTISVDCVSSALLSSSKMLRFLIDADIPYSLERLLVTYGYEAIHVRDVGLGGSPDAVIAAFAKSEKWAILTGDFDFADIRNYPPPEYFGIAVLVLTPRMVSSDIHALVRSFLNRPEIVATLEGKLAIVEIGRVRVRS